MPMAPCMDGAIIRNAAARAQMRSGHVFGNTLKGERPRARFRNGSRHLRRLPGRVCMSGVWRERGLGSMRRKGESTSLPRWLRDVRCYRGYGERSSTLQELGDGFGAGPNLELFVNAADVCVDGCVADAELLGDFFVDSPFCQAIEHFPLTGGKGLSGLLGGGALLEGLNHFPGDVGGHRRTPFEHVLDGLQQLGALGAF